MLIYDSPML